MGEGRAANTKDSSGECFVLRLCALRINLDIHSKTLLPVWRVKIVKHFNPDVLPRAGRISLSDVGVSVNGNVRVPCMCVRSSHLHSPSQPTENIANGIFYPLI